MKIAIFVTDKTLMNTFSCPGYMDLVDVGVEYKMFWDHNFLNNTGKLKALAGSVIRIIERIETVQSLNK